MADRPIAHEDGTEGRNEKLPNPIVVYPGHYGTFIGFRESEDAPVTFCSCMETAINNYAHFRTRYSSGRYSDSNKAFFISSASFPVSVVEALRETGISESDADEVVNYFRFENGLCHECNDVVPKYRYCHEMYGTKFKQNYGWYIGKKGLELGVDYTRLSGPKAPIHDVRLDACSDDILDLVDNNIREQIDRCHELNTKKGDPDCQLTEAERAELSELRDALKEQDDRLTDAVENEARQAFGHYKKGNRWTSETILYQLIESEFPEFTIRRHHRPEVLNGLELDIFIEEANVGVEYQGVQHYEPVDHWGGEEALEERQARDEAKRRLCDKHGIDLVEVRYDEDLSTELVRERIGPKLPEDSQ